VRQTANVLATIDKVRKNGIAVFSARPEAERRAPLPGMPA
jgi:hypothetical protein